jgi:hypothetical protein
MRFPVQSRAARTAELFGDLVAARRAHMLPLRRALHPYLGVFDRREAPRVSCSIQAVFGSAPSAEIVNISRLGALILTAAHVCDVGDRVIVAVAVPYAVQIEAWVVRRQRRGRHREAVAVEFVSATREGRRQPSPVAPADADQMRANSRRSRILFATIQRFLSGGGH